MPINCIICNSILKPSNISGLLKCMDCGFVTANNDLSNDELYNIYGPDYFHGQEYRNYTDEAESLKLNFRHRIKTLKDIHVDLSSFDIFEIGCAYGFFLQEIEKEVFSACGIDVCDNVISVAVNDNKVNAICGDYLTYDIEYKKDLICMWDVIEHLRDPHLFVAKARLDLKPGGLLAITTGDIGSLNAKLRGKNWRMIHPPSHLHYFNQKTIIKLLRDNGFEILHLSHPGNSRKIGSIFYALTMLYANQPKIYNFIKNFWILQKSISINLFDIMYIIARKV